MDDALVQRLAALAKLEFNAEERQLVAADMTRIVDYISQIKAADLASVEPLLHPLEQVQRMRPDTAVAPSVAEQQAALEQAPAHQDNFFQVPKVIE